MAWSSNPVNPTDFPITQQSIGQTMHLSTVGKMVVSQALDDGMEISWLPMPIKAIAKADWPIILQM